MNHTKKGLVALLIAGLIGTGLYFSRDDQDTNGQKVDHSIQAEEAKSGLFLEVFNLGDEICYTLDCSSANENKIYHSTTKKVRKPRKKTSKIHLESLVELISDIKPSKLSNRHTRGFKRDSHLLRPTYLKVEQPVRLNLDYDLPGGPQDDPVITEVHIDGKGNAEYKRFTVPKGQFDNYKPRK